jgi:hypothetical protein
MAKKKKISEPRIRTKIHLEDGIGLSDECIRALITHLLAPLLTAEFAVEHKRCPEPQSQQEYPEKIAA